MTDHPERLTSISGRSSPEGDEVLLTFKTVEGSQHRYLVDAAGLGEVIAALDAHHRRANERRSTRGNDTNATPRSQRRLTRYSGGMTEGGTPLLALDFEGDMKLDIPLDLRMIRDLSKIFGILEKAMANRAAPTNHKPN